jgi:nucleotide-binding universal stress UspA family protein
MTELILVGTDGSETATIAVSEAADLAANLGAKLLILSAFPSIAMTRLGEQAHNVPAPKHWRSASRSDAEEVLAKAVDSLGQTDVSVETVAQEGDPAEAIIRVAEERKADIVVVGNKGMGGIQRFLLGSVPSRVAHHAPCSVFIVRTT